ncbi:MAG TPA: pantoate--beta-alanine ligase, partial [bacterium]|nr:pantoate--beta-alanine ligase [bacterium]
QRRQALILSQSVKWAEKTHAAGETDVQKIITTVTQMIRAAGPDLEIKYVTVVNPKTLEPVAKVGRGAVLLIEVYVGKTRLYDNVIF